jgi:hypothetical protein
MSSPVVLLLAAMVLSPSKNYAWLRDQASCCFSGWYVALFVQAQGERLCHSMVLRPSNQGGRTWVLFDGEGEVGSTRVSLGHVTLEAAIFLDD